MMTRFESIEKPKFRLHERVSDVTDGNMSKLWTPTGSGEWIVNYNRFLLKQGFDPKLTVLMSTPIKSSTDVGIVSADTLPKTDEDGRLLQNGEALITTERNLALSLLTGDCMSITIFDPNKGVLALAHGGRKSVGAGLITAVIEKMRDDFDAVPESIIVHIAPFIHKESYVFPINAQDIGGQLETESQSTEWQPFLLEKDGFVQVDIRGLAVSQMLACGIKEVNIHTSNIDTRTSTSHFSHARATDPTKTAEERGSEGRFATIVMMM